MNVKPLDDTSPMVSSLLIEEYRKMTATEKIDRVRVLTLAVQELALADSPRRHPEANMLANRLFGLPPVGSILN
jgi:hypothetical protein